MTKKEIEKIRKDKSVTHCYILKGGYYYRSNYCGYTEHVEAAGIYPKEDAISHCQITNELKAYPIDNVQHNKRILSLIDQLRENLINVPGNDPV